MSARLIPVRASNRAGDIAELVTPEELTRRQRAAAAAPAIEMPAMDFGTMPTIAAPAPSAPAPTPASDWAKVRPYAIALGSLVVMLALIAALPLLGDRAVSSSAVVISVPPTVPASTARPTLTPPPTQAPILVDAFWAPAGVGADKLDLTQPYTATERFGQDWVGVDVVGGGHLWLSLDQAQLDRTAAFLALPDRQPPPTATPAPYVPPPTATPIPQPPCLSAGTDTQIVTVCGWGDLQAEARQKWIATYGGNIGTVLPRPTLAPQP